MLNKVKLRMMTCAVLLAPSLSHAAVLFDADFVHANNGDAIVIDGSSTTASAMLDGSVTKQDDFLSFSSDDWAVFNTPACDDTESISFVLPAGTKEIYLSYELHVKGLVDSDNMFAMFIDGDSYTGRNLQLHASFDKFRFFNQGFNQLLDSFVDDETYQVDVFASTSSNSYVLSVDGEEVMSSSFGSDTDITAVRFRLARWTGAATNCSSTQIGLSHVKIYEDPSDLIVNEEITAEKLFGGMSAMSLSILALLALWRLPRRKHLINQ